MQHLPICIIRFIFDKLDLKTQYKLKLTCKTYYAKLHSKYIDLKDTSYNIPKHVNPIIFKMEDSSININLNHMTNLKKLYCGNSDLENESIKDLDLTELYMSSNYYLHEINHLTNLKVLKCNYTVLKYLKLNNLNPIILHVSNTSDDINLNHITDLKKLYCSSSNITDNNIKNLDLEELHINITQNITKVNVFKNLKVLKCYLSAIDYNSLIGLNLTELYISDILNLGSLNFMINLKKLSCIRCNIKQLYIIKLHLEELCLMCDTEEVFDLREMYSLKKVFYKGKGSILVNIKCGFEKYTYFEKKNIFQII